MLPQLTMMTGEILLKTVSSLTKTNEEQSRQLVAQSNQIAELTAELKKMSAQIAWFQRQMYGRKSERHISIDNQPSLFADMEEETTPTQAMGFSPNPGKSRP